MKVNVSIDPDILDWIINQVTPGMLSPDMMDRLYAWKSGEKNPTYNQVEDMSKATGIPFGYFFLKTPPEEDLSFTEYRTIDSIQLNNPSRELIDTMHDMEMVQEWVKTHLAGEGAEKLSFVQSVNINEGIEMFSAKVRLLLGLEYNWYEGSKNAEDSFRFLRERISETGVIVMMSGIVGNNTHRPLDVNEFRAFTLVDTMAPVIFINSKDSSNGKLFSLLHEFAHICLGVNSLYNTGYHTIGCVNKTETLCNAVAAEILVPLDDFLMRWNSLNRQRSIEEIVQILAKEYKCGTIVIARRALDSNAINRNEYKSIVDKAVKSYLENKRKTSGGDYYRTAASRIDRRFIEMLAGSVAQGKTLYSEAFRLTNTNRVSFAKLLSKVEAEM